MCAQAMVPSHTGPVGERSATGAVCGGGYRDELVLIFVILLIRPVYVEVKKKAIIIRIGLCQLVLTQSYNNSFIGSNVLEMILIGVIVYVTERGSMFIITYKTNTCVWLLRILSLFVFEYFPKSHFY